MRGRRLPAAAVGLCIVALVPGCGSSSAGTGSGLSLVAVHPWDGGADAGCTIGSAGVKVGCATTYTITGDPFACPGFLAGAGTTTACKSSCMGQLTCQLTGLSNGKNAVECTSDCSSPER